MPNAVSVEWVFPAGGAVGVYRIDGTDDEPEHEDRVPLLGWGLVKGRLVPLDARPDGVVTVASRWSNFVRVEVRG